MEHLEKLEGWLAGFPGWVASAVDTTDPVPESCGLFPLGLEVLERREDVLGNASLRCRESYLVRRVACRDREAARWLLEFQQWVNSQGEFPALGSRCRIRAEKGRLVSTSQSGTATYGVKLTCEYGKELANGED